MCAGGKIPPLSTGAALGFGVVPRPHLADALLFLVLASGALAQVSWTGGASTGDWGTAGNWDTPPVTTDVATFDAANANSQFSITLGANRTIGGLVFSSTGSNAFTFNAGNRLTVGASGIVNNHSLTQTFAAEVRSSGTQIWDAAAGGLTFNDLRLASNVTLTGGNAVAVNGTLTNFNGSRSFTNNLTAGLTLNNIELTNNSTDRTLSLRGSGTTTVNGIVSDGGTGAGTLRLRDTGTVTLNGANTHTGGTWLNGATLIMGHASALGTGTLTLQGGTLDGGAANRTIANAVSLVSNTSFGGSADLTFTNTLTLANNRTLTLAGSGQTVLNDIALSADATAHRLILAGSGDLTIDGTISDGAAPSGGRLNKTGTGTLTLNGTNTYTGDTTLTAGTVIVGSDAAFGDGTGSVALGTMTLQGDGTTRSITNDGTLTGNLTIAGASDLNLGGTFTLTGNRTLTLDNTGTTTFGGFALSSNTNNRTLTLAGSGDLDVTGAITNGSGGALAPNLTVTGSGTITLDGNNSYGGTTRLDAGTLVLNGTNTTTGNFDLNGGTLTIGNNDAFGTSLIDLSGTTLQSDGTARSVSNDLQLTGSTATIGGASDLALAGTLTLTGNRTLAITNTSATTFGAVNLSDDSNSRTFTVDNTGNATIAGVIADGGTATASGLTKSGTGDLTLAGANTFGGTTTVNNGTLIASHADALGTTAGGTAVATGASLELRNNITLTGEAVTLTGTGTLANTTDANTFAGTLSGTGGVSVSGGSLTLSTANTYTGGTSVSGGTLVATHNEALGDAGTGTTVAAGGTLELQNGITIASEALSVTGSGQLLNTAGANTYGGVISGTGGVTVTGGELIVTAANTYTGTTDISAGTLTLGSASRLSTGTTVAIGGSGTFNLAGFDQRVGDLSAAGGATLDFGSTTGANAFVFDTFTAPPSGVLVINNWEDGVDQLATTVGAQDVSTIYLAGFGVAELDTGTTTVLGTSAYLITAATLGFKEWDGGGNDSNWGTNQNWAPGAGEPSATEYALFDDEDNGKATIALDQTDTIAGIEFGANATVSYTLNSATTEVLTLAGAVPFIQQKNALDQTISLYQLQLGNNTVADITGAGDLIISADITDGGSGYSLVRDGGGTGQLVLSGDNTFSGGLYLNSGITEAQSSGALGTGTAVIASGAALNLNAPGTIDENITFAGTGVSNGGVIHNLAGTTTLSGTLTATSSSRITTDNGTTLNLSGNLTGTDTNLTFAAAGTGAIQVSQITTGTGAVTLESGDLTFTGANANTYTGLTTVAGGTLTLNKSAGVDAIGSGGLTLADGTTATLQANQQINDAATVTLLGTSTFDLGGNTETLAQLNSASSTATVALGATGNLTIGAPGVIDSAFVGQLTGGAGSSLSIDGGGTVSLSGNNTSLAATVNVASGNLHASGSNEALGSGTLVVSAGGTLQLEGGINLDNTVQLAGTGSAANGAVENVSGNNTLSGAVSLSAATTFNTTADTLSVTGVISGSNDLTKTGTGTLVLSGSNTYTGATTVTGGTLSIAAESNLGATPASSTTGHLTLDGGILNTTATLSLDANRGIAIDAGGGDFAVATGTTTSLNGVISGTGTLTKSGDGTLVVNGTNTHTGSLTLSAGDLELNAAQSFTGNLFLDAGTVTVGDDSAFGSGVVRLRGATLQGDGTARTLDNVVRVQDTSTIAGSSALTFTNRLVNHNGDNTLNLTNSANTTFNDVELSNNSTNRSFTLNHTGEVIILGIVSDGSSTASNLITSGTGRLTLSGANTFSGDLTIGSGTTLLATNNDALGSGGGTTTVQSGGTLELTGGITVDSETGITLAGTGTAGQGAVLSSSGNNVLDSTFTLSGATTVTATADTLTLGSQVNSYEFDLNGYDLTLNTDGGNITVESDLTGVGDIIKNGSGTLLLNHGEAYIPDFLLSPDTDFYLNDGLTILNTYNNDNAGMRGEVIVGDGVGAAGSAVLQQGLYESGVDISSNLISDSSNITINADGYWDLQGHKEVINNLTMNGGTVEAKNSSGTGDRLDLIGTLTASNNATSTIDGRLGFNNDTAKSVVVDSGSTLQINAVLSNGGFNKTGDGTLVLSGANSFTGTALVSDGILKVDNNSGLGATYGGTQVLSGAQLQLDGVTIGSEALSLAGTGHNSDGSGALRALAGTTNSWGGAVTLTANSEIQTESGASLTIGGNITGSGKTLTVESIGDTTFTGNNTFNTLEKNGAGTLTVSGINTYATTNVNAGTFALGNSNILSDSMDINLGASGTFDVGTYTETIDQLNGSGTLTIASGGDLTIDQLGSAGAFTGVLDVDGILTLNGGTIGAADGTGSTGTIELTASNTLNIVDNFTFGGTLELGDATTLNLVNDGTTFNVGTLRVTGDSVIDFAGADIGTLNIGTLEIDLGGTILATNWNSFYDLWTATNFTGATIDERNSTTAQITFSGFNASDTIWLTYDYGSNEITVPEPSTYGALLMSALAGLYVWRRRNQQRASAERQKTRTSS